MNLAFTSKKQVHCEPLIGPLLEFFVARLELCGGAGAGLAHCVLIRSRYELPRLVRTLLSEQAR